MTYVEVYNCHCSIHKGKGKIISVSLGSVLGSELWIRDILIIWAGKQQYLPESSDRNDLDVSTCGKVYCIGCGVITLFLYVGKYFFHALTAL